MAFCNWHLLGSSNMFQLYHKQGAHVVPLYALVTCLAPEWLTTGPELRKVLGDAWSSRFAQDMPQSRSGFAFVRGVNLFHLVAIAKAGLVKKTLLCTVAAIKLFRLGPANLWWGFFILCTLENMVTHTQSLNVIKSNGPMFWKRSSDIFWWNFFMFLCRPRRYQQWHSLRIWNSLTDG